MRQKVRRLARAVPAWILVVVLILSMVSVAHAEDSAPVQVHGGGDRTDRQLQREVLAGFV